MDKETYLEIEKEALKNSFDSVSFTIELNKRLEKYNKRRDNGMRKLVICNYFEGVLVKAHCPFCGLPNCKEHVNLKDYISYDDLTLEEQKEVSRLISRINGKNWALETDQCEGGFDAYLKFDDVVDGVIKTIYVEICEELDDDEIEEEHTCANPNCACGGKCKVCKCSLEYDFKGDYLEKLTIDDFKMITHLLEALDVEKGSEVVLGKSGVENRFVPHLMATVTSTGDVINTGISFEMLADRL